VAGKLALGAHVIWWCGGAGVGPGAGSAVASNDIRQRRQTLLADWNWTSRQRSQRTTMRAFADGSVVAMT
jgi:hypothetical protein